MTEMLLKRTSVACPLNCVRVRGGGGGSIYTFHPVGVCIHLNSALKEQHSLCFELLIDTNAEPSKAVLIQI